LGRRFAGTPEQRWSVAGFQYRGTQPAVCHPTGVSNGPRGFFLALLAAWGSCSDCGTCPADFDGDCSVSILDLLILLGNWG